MAEVILTESRFIQILTTILMWELHSGSGWKFHSFPMEISQTEKEKVVSETNRLKKFYAEMLQKKSPIFTAIHVTEEEINATLERWAASITT